MALAAMRSTAATAQIEVPTSSARARRRRSGLSIPSEASLEQLEEIAGDRGHAAEYLQASKPTRSAPADRQLLFLAGREPLACSVFTRACVEIPGAAKAVATVYCT